MKRIAALLLWVFVASLFILACLRWTSIFEPEDIVDCTSVRVLDYRSTRKFAYFVVQMPDGRQLFVNGSLDFPPDFRGETTAIRKRGHWTGREHLQLMKDAKCRPT